MQSRKSLRQPSSGPTAERCAERHLQVHDLTLLTRNFRSRFGELDLVMLDNEVLVIVEVRYRHKSGQFSPAQSVDFHKQRRLIGATQIFLRKHQHHANRRVRFDVVGITGELDSPQIEWIQHAFDCDDMSE